MYIQITNRCNMTCAHCCYDCKAEGQDMSLTTFRQALNLCSDHGLAPFIGGGEPTLHPKFDTILLETMAVYASHGFGVASIITNGSIKKKALMLAELTHAGLLSASLSQDEYHDPIDPEVVEAFKRCGRPTSGGGNTAFWDTSGQSSRDPFPHGRAVQLLGLDDPEELEEAREHQSVCPCSSWMVRPDGRIFQCGCNDAPQIGTTKDGVCSPCQECFRSSWFITECTENEEYEYLLV